MTVHQCGTHCWRTDELPPKNGGNWYRYEPLSTESVLRCTCRKLRSLLRRAWGALWDTEEVRCECCGVIDLTLQYFRPWRWVKRTLGAGR